MILFNPDCLKREKSRSPKRGYHKRSPDHAWWNHSASVAKFAMYATRDGRVSRSCGRGRHIPHLYNSKTQAKRVGA